MVRGTGSTPREGADHPAGGGAMSAIPESVDDTEALLAAGHYLADRELATAVFLALRLRRPLLLEGEAGVGKTEIAKVLAATLGRELIRLQCYEGLDIADAVYEWNHARQMLAVRLAEAAGTGHELAESGLYAERFLQRRPVLRALHSVGGETPVLLIDELDRTDAPFEAFLLEVLSDFQVTIPELGTVRAAEPPIVILTSNRTREIHDALKRRCLYHWVDYPDAARELAILERKVPEAGAALSRAVVAFVQRLRQLDLYRLPGVAETLDWARALVALGCTTLDAQTAALTLGALIKSQDDLGLVRAAGVDAMLAGAAAAQA